MKQFFFYVLATTLPVFLQARQIDSLVRLARQSESEGEKLEYLIELANGSMDDYSQFSLYLDSAYLLAHAPGNQSTVGRVKLIQGIRSFQYGMLDMADSLLKEALNLLDKKQHTLEYAKVNHYLGSTYANKDDYYTSIDYYTIAKGMYEELGNDHWLSKAYTNMGWSYRERGELGMAMEMYMKALEIAEKNQSREGLFDVYHELGYIYIEQGDTARAEQAFQKTLEIATELQSKERISYANGDLAILYFKTKDFQQSLYHNQQDLSIQLALGNNRDLPMIYNNLSDCFFELKAYDSAVHYANLALQVDITQRSTYENAQSKINLAKVSMITENYPEARQLLLQALEAADAINSIDIKRNALDQLHKLSEVTGNYKDALEYYRRYKSLKDSIFNLETNRQIEEIKAKYELNQQQQRILHLDLEKQNAESRRNLYLVALILSSLIALILLLYSRHIRIKNGMILRREKRIAEAQMEKATAELMLYTKMLSEKNNLIHKLQGEYNKVKEKISEIAPDSTKKIRNLLASTLLTDDEWSKFKDRFEQIYPDFFYTLRARYPDLSHTDEKLLALSRLKLRNKEIAAMLGVSPGSVAKSKNRLSKKLKVKADQLSEIASSI